MTSPLPQTPSSYVIVLGWTSPNTGAQQVFGPFGSSAEAEQALVELKSWPAMATASGDFDIVPCTMLLLGQPKPNVTIHSSAWPASARGAQIESAAGIHQQIRSM